MISIFRVVLWILILSSTILIPETILVFSGKYFVRFSGPKISKVLIRIRTLKCLYQTFSILRVRMSYEFHMVMHSLLCVSSDYELIKQYIGVVYWEHTHSSFERDVVFPGHALHEKCLQRHSDVVPLGGSQEKRDRLVPQFNRRSSARQALVVFLHRFKLDFVFSSVWKDLYVCFLYSTGSVH